MGDAPAAALLDLPVEARQKALAQALATDEAGALRILSEMSGLAV